MKTESRSDSTLDEEARQTRKYIEDHCRASLVECWKRWVDSGMKQAILAQIEKAPAPAGARNDGLLSA